MNGPTYPAARLIALEVEKHFRDCASSVDVEIGPRPEIPSSEVIESILSAAFWASLRREEGRAPKISIAFVPPDRSEDPLRLARPLALDPSSLVKLAPAVERPSIHLGAALIDGALQVWGTTRSIPASTFVVEVVEPGLLVIKRRRGNEGGKFANVAVLQGDQVLRIQEDGDELALHGPLGASMFGSDLLRPWVDPYNIILQLAVSMRDHGHGGTLLLVPEDRGSWRESIALPIPYPVEPPFDQLTLLASSRGEAPDQASHGEAVQRSVAAIAGLTAVDGATILTQRFELLAFGAKIARRAYGTPVEWVKLIEPVVGSEPRIIDTAELGGTRHLSAAQFAADQPGALALVASQDGRFTVFSAGEGEPAVHAHRIDALLL